MPDRADGVNHKSRGQFSAGGLDGFARWEMAIAGDDLAALFEDGGTTGTMDCAVNSASAYQAGIGGVDDGVSGLLRDVARLEEDLRTFSEVEPNDVIHDLFISQRFHAG